MKAKLKLIFLGFILGLIAPHLVSFSEDIIDRVKVKFLTDTYEIVVKTDQVAFIKVGDFVSVDNIRAGQISRIEHPSDNNYYLTLTLYNDRQVGVNSDCRINDKMNEDDPVVFINRPQNFYDVALANGDTTLYLSENDTLSGYFSSGTFRGFFPIYDSLPVFKVVDSIFTLTEEMNQRLQAIEE